VIVRRAYCNGCGGSTLQRVLCGDEIAVHLGEVVQDLLLGPTWLSQVTICLRCRRVLFVAVRDEPLSADYDHLFPTRKGGKT